MENAVEQLRGNINTQEGRGVDGHMSVRDFISTLREGGSKLVVLVSLDGKGVIPAQVHKYKIIRWLSANFSLDDEVRAFSDEVDGDSVVFVDDKFGEKANARRLQGMLQKIENSDSILSDDVKGDFYNILGEMYRK